jgi:transposase InsO family protein
VCDNGPEFTSQALDQWAYARGITLQFMRPGKPVENAYVESFNGRLRDECLNENWFATLDDARVTIERWRQGYNAGRPHSSLGDRTQPNSLPSCSLRTAHNPLPPRTGRNNWIKNGGQVNRCTSAAAYASVPNQSMTFRYLPHNQ